MADTYDRFKNEELILRDELAIDRTILANERTLLAYNRTALTLLIAGVTFLHFPDKVTLMIFGGIFFPLSLFVGIFGWSRYAKMKRSIDKLRSRVYAASS